MWDLFRNAYLVVTLVIALGSLSLQSRSAVFSPLGLATPGPLFVHLKPTNETLPLTWPNLA
jgi:hypothetical protein